LTRIILKSDAFFFYLYSAVFHCNSIKSKFYFVVALYKLESVQNPKFSIKSKSLIYEEFVFLVRKQFFENLAVRTHLTYVYVFFGRADRQMPFSRNRQSKSGQKNQIRFRTFVSKNVLKKDWRTERFQVYSIIYREKWNCKRTFCFLDLTPEVLKSLDFLAQTPKGKLLKLLS